MNKHRELEVLDSEINNARLRQKCLAGQAHLREKQLERYAGIVDELKQNVEAMGEETLERVIAGIRAKIEMLNV
jgi:hypothetical protein